MYRKIEIAWKDPHVIYNFNVVEGKTDHREDDGIQNSKFWLNAVSVFTFVQIARGLVSQAAECAGFL